MSTSQLLKQSLRYYWRTNLAVVLGVATAVAVLAGALLVGDSVRGSLRDLVIQRLGETSHVITSSSFFRDQIAGDLQNDPQFQAAGFASACPLISVEGTITHESSKRTGSKISVYGVDQRFWKFNGLNGTQAPQNRNVLISQTLANELGTTVGDSVLLRVTKPTEIPLESLHSKKDDLGKTVRLSVGQVVGAEAMGEFSIQPQQAGVRAVFVALDVLQRELEQANRVNLVLISEGGGYQRTDKSSRLSKIVQERMTLDDLGIKLRSIDQNSVSLEHDSKMVNDTLARVADEAAGDLSLRRASIFSYLANSITSGNRSIPYSLVTALDLKEFGRLGQNATRSLTDQNSALPPIIVNQWAAEDLGAQLGDSIKLEYYIWHESGRLETKSAEFELVGVVPISGVAADRDLVPEYPGITGSENLSDWDPPFEIDLKRIRQKDEDYWHQYRITPKAFIPLNVGQQLWRSRFGGLTSIRFWSDVEGRDLLTSLQEKLRAHVNPLSMGVLVLPVQAEGIEASRGATDFGEYFFYFSFFVVVSALLLATLFFKLGVEQRVREIGLLRAVGFGPSRIRKLFLLEGVLLSVIGSVLGLFGAIAYGQLMMLGLRTWWVDAVGTTSLRLHISPQSLLLGALGGIIAALICIALTLRRLGRQSTRSLLAGVASTSSETASTSSSRRITALRVAIVLSALGGLLLLAAGMHFVPQVVGFFGGGTLLLVAALLYQSSWLGKRHSPSMDANIPWPIARLGFRNTRYRPGRSILSIALIASAAFIIVAVDSFRHRDRSSTERDMKSGTGGFALIGESLVPLVNDPSTREGREALNLRTNNDIKLSRFRLQPGDDTSCLNLYQPRNPRIVAPTEAFVKSNRFSFQSSLAANAEETSNPWLLLHREFSDGAIPVIADANSLTYVLHLKLGEDIVIQDRDRTVNLRVVAALSNSLFQSELLMSEKNFIRLFPEQQGYRFFLIDVSDETPSSVAAATLEDELSDYGLDVQPTSERLATFHRVENTYLSTFQMLGGLGLILGTVGLSAVLLRNILERRRELALMRAVGYNSRHFTTMIIAENALLLFGGVITGSVCAVFAIAPVFFTRQGSFSTMSLGLMLLAVLLCGLIASMIATWATLRSPLLKALKAE